MFKILIEVKELNNKIKEKEPYYILVERCPLIEAVDGKTVFYQSNYSSKQKAKIAAAQIEKYFENSFFFLDLIYSKIKQLELTELVNQNFNKSLFSVFENSRIDLILSSKKEMYAWAHIDCFLIHIRNLKKMCFAVSSYYSPYSNSLFDFLVEFEKSFIRTYRSFGILNEGGQLQFFP